MRLRQLQVPAILFLVVLGFYWRLVLTNQYTWLHGPDFANQVLPWYQFEAGEWHKWRVPLWDPYEWAGQSIIGQGQPGVADPLNLPMFLWPLRKSWLSQGVLHWFYVLPHWIAAMGFYALCRELSRSKIASIFAACLYTLGGLGSSLDWPQMNHATVWGPVALLFVFRAGRGKTPLVSGILSGFFLGLAWLAGHHQIPIYFALVTVGFWIHFFVTQKDRRREIAQAAAAAMIFMFLVSAVQTLPALEYGRSARRFVGAEHELQWNETVPYYVHETFSMSPLSVLGIVLPGFETSYPPHLGFIVILLGLFGMATTWEDRSTRWLTAIAAGGMAYSLGAHTVVQGVFYAFVPMIEKARVPAIAQIIFDMGICGLAAAGLDHLHKADWWRQRLAWTFGAIGVVLLAAGIVFTIMHVIWPTAEDRWVMSGWIAVACWLVLRRQTRHTVAWLAFLALTEISLTSARAGANNEVKWRANLLDNMAAHDDIAGYVRSKPGAPRMSYVLDDIPYSFGDFWGIETIEAMVPSVPEELWRNNVWSRRTNQLFGVRYYASKKPRFEELIKLFDSRSGITVWEDPQAQPRIWTVHSISVVKDLVEAVKRLEDTRVDIASQTFVIGTQAPMLQTCNGNELAAYDKRVPNRLTIHAEMACRGMVIVPDLYDRNWIAEVDGRQTVIYEAYAMVRGVVVDKGTHKVELIYRPLSVYAGALLTFVGIAGAFIAMGKARR